MKKPDLTRRALRTHVRRAVIRVVAATGPVARPIAWRTRTFLTEPSFQVETELRTRADVTDARNAARFDQIVALLGAAERSADTRAREANKILVGLRIILEEQDDEIAALRDDIRLLRARIVELETAE